VSPLDAGVGVRVVAMQAVLRHYGHACLVDVLAAVQQLQRATRVHLNHPNHWHLTALLHSNAQVFGYVKAEGSCEKHRDSVFLAGDIEGGGVSGKQCDVLQRQAASAAGHTVRRVHELRWVVPHDAHGVNCTHNDAGVRQQVIDSISKNSVQNAAKLHATAVTQRWPELARPHEACRNGDAGGQVVSVSEHLVLKRVEESVRLRIFAAVLLAELEDGLADSREQLGSKLRHRRRRVMPVEFEERLRDFTNTHIHTLPRQARSPAPQHAPSVSLRSPSQPSAYDKLLPQHLNSLFRLGSQLMFLLSHLGKLRLSRL
jgi:hypothetical protein